MPFRRPTPVYQDDGRVYGMNFAGMEIKFFVSNGTLTVTEIKKETNE